MQNLERRFLNRQEEIDDFMKKFGVLQSKGLPSPLVINDKLMTQLDYLNKLDKYVDNKANSYSSTTKEIPTGRVLFDNLKNLFYVEHEIKHLFQVQPDFFRCTEANEILRKLQGTRIPQENWCSEMIEIL